MSESRLETVKKEIRSILLPNKNEVSLEQFVKDHRNYIGTRLPTREFGFRTDIEFLQSLPDVVQFSRASDGTFLLKGLSDENTEHIEKMVSLQKKPSKPKPSFRRDMNNRTVSNSFPRAAPFLPASLRSEIYNIVKPYANGIGFNALVKLYQNTYGHPLNLECLAVPKNDLFKTLANCNSGIVLKVVNEQERIYVQQNFESATKQSVNGYRKNHDIAFPTERESFSKPSSYLDSLKYNCEKVMKKCPNGVLALHFPVTYKKICGETLDIIDYGFNCLLDLVDALPATMKRIKSSINENDWLLLPANDLIGDDHSSRPKDWLTPEKYQPYANGESSNSKLSPKVKVSPHCCDATLTFTQPSPPGEICETFMPVFVSEIVSPTTFYFKLNYSEPLSEFKMFEGNLQSFYNSYDSKNLKMSSCDVRVGATCVAFCSNDDFWYRSVIVSLPNLNYASVWFVDYGSTEKVHRSELRYIWPRFMDTPVDAFECRLSYVKPLNEDNSWSTTAQTRFKNLCNSTSMKAQIKSVKEGKFSVLLQDYIEEKNICINDVLIDEMLAQSCPSDDFKTELMPIADFKQSVENFTHFNQQKSFSNGTGKPLSKFSMNLDNSFESHNGEQSSDLQIKRIVSNDGYKLHIVNMNNELYVIGHEVSNLLWSDENADVLSSNMRLKNINIPSIFIHKDSTEDIFNKCERNLVKLFEDTDDISVEMYPLRYLITILNSFGHPSSGLRKSISNELEIFYPSEPMWHIFHIEESVSENSFFENNELDRSCLHDLKEMREGLTFRRKKLISKSIINNCVPNDLAQLELLHMNITRRIADIEQICFLYSDKVLDCL